MPASIQRSIAQSLEDGADDVDPLLPARPSSQEPEVVDPEDVPEVLQVSHSTDVIDVIIEDAKHSNFVLAKLVDSWQNVETIDDTCKLAMTTMKILKDRRELLNKQLGAVKITTSNSGYLTPYEQ